MITTQTASNSLHPPVIAGVSRMGRVGGFLRPMKPRPTEYKRVKLRSKTEAIFARCLDIVFPGAGWEYEPDWLALDDGYTPDFVMPWLGGVSGFAGIMVWEVKPSSVTKCYRTEWEGRCDQLRKQVGRVPVLFLLQDGFAFGDGEPITWEKRAWHYDTTGGPTMNSFFRPLIEAVPEAKNYRFDLQH